MKRPVPDLPFSFILTDVPRYFIKVLAVEAETFDKPGLFCFGPVYTSILQLKLLLLLALVCVASRNRVAIATMRSKIPVHRMLALLCRAALNTCPTYRLPCRSTSSQHCLSPLLEHLV